MRVNILALTQIENLVDVLGLAFGAIAVVLFLLLGLYLLNSYRKSRRDSTLYMSLILLFGCLALISLVIEQLLLRSSGVTAAEAPPMKSFLEFSANEIDVFWLAYLFAVLAWVTSGTAILSACFFTQSFYSEKYRKLLIIPALMLAGWVLINTAAPFQWTEIIGDWQPDHDPILEIIAYLLLFPNLWMIVLLFFYLTFSLYRRGIPRWKQIIVLAFGQTFLSLGFTVEILNIQDPIISMLARFAIMIYPIVTYFGLRRGG